MEQPTIESYMKRANIYLEDKEWQKADEYFEKVLDMNPENGYAYFGKLLVSFKFTSLEELMKDRRRVLNRILKNNFYQKALQFADDSLKNTLFDFVTERKYFEAKDYISTAAWRKNERKDIESEFVPEYFTAIQMLSEIETYKDSKALKLQCIDSIEHEAAIALEKQLYHTAGEYYQYISKFKNVDDQLKKCAQGKDKYNLLREQLAVRMARRTIAAGKYHSIAIKTDGKLYATSYKYKDFDGEKHYTYQCDVNEKIWSDIVSVSAASKHTVALKIDGTVIATKPFDKEKNWYYEEVESKKYEISFEDDRIIQTPIKERELRCESLDLNYCGQCDVAGWNDIIAISAGEYHTVGLKKDGTVISTAYKGNPLYDHGQTNVDSWSDIIAIAAGKNITVGLKGDGTLICTDPRLGFKDIKDVLCFTLDKLDYVSVLRTNGEIVESSKIIETTLDNVMELCYYPFRTIVTLNSNLQTYTSDEETGIKINELQGITSIASRDHFLALKQDGSMVAIPSPSKRDYDMGQCSVSRWKNVAQPPAAKTFKELFEFEKNLKIQREKESKAKKEAARIKRENQKIAAQKAAEEKARKEKEAQIKATYRINGLCQHCGGAFKGFFTKTCSQCGLKKDY